MVKGTISKNSIKIAVDLTPILSGGINGGAKIMTLRLIQQLSIQAPNYHFILICTKENYTELSQLECKNIQIFNLSKSTKEKLEITNDHTKQTSPKQYITLLNNFPKIKKIIQYAFSECKNYLFSKKIKRLIQPDILFCPFTAPFFYTLKVPIISVIYDLQFIYYPYFFSEKEVSERKKHFKAACKQATKLISISEFTKKTILENNPIKPEKIKTIYIKQAYRLTNIQFDSLTKTLQQYRVTENNFLLYPANFWPHKNHSLLITAFNIYLNQYPHRPLKLVCTGTDNLQKKQLINSVKRMGLANSIIFPGYLTDTEFSHVLNGCLALIFPSLYEGFGMPILEAMAVGKPVLCSNITSMPEITENAALLFDPRKPEEIANTIKQITDPVLLKKLVRLGSQRIKHFANETDMANEYLQVFQETLKINPRI
ncbi:MAG: glycosyltransferase family 4 protein [Gammaproteobacteria bacterium]|nr:glycosyltransferase family 4 protein [Gammaproteobacteria bacterium]